VAFSHFGDMLVSSGGDFQVVIWNMKDFTIFAMYDEAMAPVKISSPVALSNACVRYSEIQNRHSKLFSVFLGLNR